MPTILDYSQVAVSTLVSDVAQAKGQTMVAMDENFVRHMVLNTVRSHAAEAKPLGEFVIACDGRNSWRRKVFPQYKAGRSKGRDASELDWEMIHRVLHDVRDALKEFFPVKVIHVEGAEADDVIGVAARKWHTRGTLNIVSGDKDFQQLQKTSDDSLGLVGGEGCQVTQTSPNRKVGKIVCPDPSRFLGLHVLRGDGGDGIPPVTCPADFLVERARLKELGSKPPRAPSITGEMEEAWLSYWNVDRLDDKFFEAYGRGEIWKTISKRGVTPEQLEKRYLQNMVLIDLSFTPSHIEAEILSKLNETPRGDVVTALQWMGAHGMNELMGKVTDFV